MSMPLMLCFHPHPLGPLTENVAEIETMSAEVSKQQTMLEVDKGIAAPNPLITFEDPISEMSSRVAAT